MSTSPKPSRPGFIILLIELILSIIAVVICGHFEINSFYNDPSHIGFAIPIMTFLLAGFCLLIIIITAVICIVRAVIRRRSSRKQPK